MKIALAFAACCAASLVGSALGAPLPATPALAGGQNILQENGEITLNGGPVTVVRYTWRDASGLPRSASLIPASAATSGYAVQFTYQSGGHTVFVNTDAAGDGGFGYFVSHELFRQFDDGSNDTIASKHGEDDSPFGRYLPSTGTGQSVGSAQAVHEYRLDYPHWGTSAVVVSPSSTTISASAVAHQKFSLPVVIRWTFIAGRDHPLWSVDYDLTSGADHIAIDVRGPYGVMYFNEGVGAAVTSLNWGDAYLFSANGNGTDLGALAQPANNTPWSWGAVNAGRRFNVLGSGTYEFGLVDTVMPAGWRYGDGYANNRTHTSASGAVNCSYGLQSLPCDWEWAYQSFQYDAGPPARPKLGWGSAPFLGSSEPVAYSDAIHSEPLVNVKGHIYYALRVVMGKNAAGAPITKALASAAADPDVALSVSASPAAAGNVTYRVLGDANTYSDAGRSLAAWSSVALTATPNGANNFQGWSGACAGVTGNTCIIAVDAAKSVTATFTGGVVPAQLSMSTSAIDFGGQSMNTTSPTQSVVLSNTGGAALTISSITTAAPFTQTNNCGLLAPSASCTVQVTFTPPAGAGALNSAVSFLGNITVAHDAAGSPSAVTLAGSGEKSLVSHYYRSILRRAPDAGGKAFWQGEAARVAGLGANVNEAWFALATTFFASAEYASFARDDAGFVTDMYKTFFNRDPDSTGLAFWVGQVTGGMPRETVLTAFLFSAEFQAFTQAIFGNVAVGPEVDLTMDFYRGLLSRLPDSGGFAFYLGQMRAAQCQGAAAVRAQAEAMSQQFSTSPEYGNRNRSNAQFVSDLYNAVLRRGGDLGGVVFWIQQLNGGAMTRETVRTNFVSSPEFTNRVNAIIARGCQP